MIQVLIPRTKPARPSAGKMSGSEQAATHAAPTPSSFHEPVIFRLANDCLRGSTTSSYLSFNYYFQDASMSRFGLSIGDVARQAKCSVAAVRYYEEVGLLPSASRRSGGHRVYGTVDLNRLSFIRRCRDFGFTVAETRELLAVAKPGTPCVEAREIAAARLRTVRSKLVELQALESSLAGFVRTCSSTCAGGTVEDCTLFDDISRQTPRPAAAEAEAIV